MKVLLVWTGPETTAERSILVRREGVLIERLLARGVEVHVALCGDRAALAPHLAGVVHVLRSPLPPNAASLVRLPRAALQLRRLVREVQPDVIEAAEAMPAIAAGLATIGTRRNRAVIYRRQHGGDTARQILASRMATWLTQRTIVSSEEMRRNAARADRRSPERIEVATPGTAEPETPSAGATRALRRSIGIGDSARIVAVVSRLRHEKGIDILIRAADHLASRDVHLVIAGDGPEEASLRRLAGTRRTPVHFLGHRDDANLWLRAADVVAIPSRHESFGRVTLEAMARGKPIVATRAGGLVAAIADGETGRLVPPGDERALAAAIDELLADEEAAARIGAAAREEFRQRYTMDHMADSRIAAWQRCLAAAGVA